MEGEHPRLVPVPPPQEAETSEPGPAPTEAASSPPGRAWRVWVLLLLLVLVGVAYGLQVRRGARLVDRVTALEAELAGARAALDSYREHLDEVRGAVAGVRGELDTLETLVSRDPEPEPQP